MSRITQLKRSLTDRRTRPLPYVGEERRTREEGTRRFPDVPAPSLWLLASEYRSLWEICVGIATFKPLSVISPKGDGHPVLIIPGLSASDASMTLMKNFLDSLGYTTFGWGFGRNVGLTEERILELRDRLIYISELHGKKVSVIGHSLGGVYARELARLNPELVRQVITLGSPFTGHPLASTGTHLYEFMSGVKMNTLDFKRHLDMRVKPPVPTTSIYSKMDGVVAWQCSIEQSCDTGESINVRGCSHIGMASAPNALYLVGERLSQEEGHWNPFVPYGFQNLIYGTEDHL